MSSPPNHKIVLGVAGGIAAYKGCDLVRRLRERNFEVRVVMTAAAREFVAPLTFQALSSHPVHYALLDEEAEAGMGHIELARWADLVLIAPATAHVIARLAHGLADDLLTTLCLATTAPLVLAPAMNQQMWQAYATQANVRTLLDRGVAMLGPGEGDQACGEVGPGRMLEPEEIAAHIGERLGDGGGLEGSEVEGAGFGGDGLAGDGDGCGSGSNGGLEGGGSGNGNGLGGVEVLITAGPTREALDPVRFLTNHSTGKMGYAVATAAAEAGARVSLVSGPTALAEPPGVARIGVTSAEEMYAEVMARAEGCDIFIAAAAVADYRPARRAERKIKKRDGPTALDLVRTPDIVAGVAALDRRPFTVGFAAETESLKAHARDKLERKGLDMIAANQVGLADRGFASERNALSVLWRDGGHRELALAPKADLARSLIALVTERYRAAHPA